jgi:allophanate hydrolase subunit 1
MLRFTPHSVPKLRKWKKRHHTNQLGVAILERRTTIYKISSLGSFDLFATVT